MECQEDQLLEAAEALLLLSRTPPPDRPPDSKAPAVVPAKSIENVVSMFLPPWGFRSRRSRCTGKSKREQMEGASCGHRSPDTPLDLQAASDPSTSGSDGFPSTSEIPPFKRFRSGEISGAGSDAHMKVIVVERSPMVEAVRPSSQHVKRQGRKKTKSELQAEERFLMEDKKRLMKILESELIERDAILAENRRLLSELASSQRAPAEAETAKLKFLLPDLNEPVLDRLDQDCDEN